MIDCSCEPWVGKLKNDTRALGRGLQNKEQTIKTFVTANFPIVLCSLSCVIKGMPIDIPNKIGLLFFELPK
jgi:hypothetical protein